MPQLRKYKRGGKAFPDLTGDGKVTRADILKGRGVFGRKKKKKERGGTVDYIVGGAIAAGLGQLAQRSKNPLLQKVGNVASMVGGMTPQGKAVNMAANAFLPGGAGGGGGQGGMNVLGMLPQLFSGEQGMKVGPKMKYATHGGEIHGDPTGDPVPHSKNPTMEDRGTGFGEDYDDIMLDTQGTPMNLKVRDVVREEFVPGAGAEFITNVGMQEGLGDGAIASYNKNSLLSGNLTDKEFEDVMNSSFGQEYLKGATKENIGQLYKENYLTKVNDLFNNSPEEALSRVNEMAEVNQNFATKLKGKSDEEKLRITRDLMSDGLIGDFHGTILDEYRETPKFSYYGFKKPPYGNKDFNMHGYKPGDVFHIGYGMKKIANSAKDLDDLLRASAAEGVDLRDEKQALEWLPGYLERDGVNTMDAQRARNADHYQTYMLASNQADFFSPESKEERKQFYGGTDPFGNYRVMMPDVSAQYFQEQRDEADRVQEVEENKREKEQFMQESMESDQQQFMKDYFQRKGITAPTELQLLAAERAFERSQMKTGGVVSYGYGGGVKMLRKK